jgi:glycosyltransferase involved in cell wall biosynthesis
MKVAFYAPLKPPDHANPSGDRLIARLLLEALRRSGNQPMLVSRFRSWEGRGDAVRQDRLRRVGERLGQRLLRRLLALDPASRPRCWFTYHLYHKAPDWIGPLVSKSLGIPYIVAEGTVAEKQRNGPWRQGFAAATAAITEADLVLAINSTDLPGVASVVADPARIAHLPPFLDLAAFEGRNGREQKKPRLADKLRLPLEPPWLVTVAMMRVGNKLDSYRTLAKALHRCPHLPWHLIIVGDGAMRTEVEAAFSGELSARVTFTGRYAHAELPALLGACDLCVWPALAEPLGMALLEAQAAGLPVVAGNSGGVSDIVREGETGRLLPPGDADSFADAVISLLDDTAARIAMGKRARKRTREIHDLDSAARSLDEWLRQLTAARRP